MMRIYFVSFWSPGSFKIKKRAFLKGRIYLSPEKSADFKVPLECQSTYSLDFESAELLHCDSSERIPCREQELCEVDGGVLQWKAISFEWKNLWDNPSTRLSFLSLFLLLGFVIWFAFSGIREEPCSPSLNHFAQGNWSPRFHPPQVQEQASVLSQNRETYFLRLKEKDWIGARVQLNEIQRLMEALDPGNRCHLQKSVASLEEKLIEETIQRWLKDDRLIEAAISFDQFRKEFGPEFLSESLFALQLEAQKMLWKVWRLEGKEKAAATRLKADLEVVCRAISEDGNCFSRLESAQ